MSFSGSTKLKMSVGMKKVTVGYSKQKEADEKRRKIKEEV